MTLRYMDVFEWLRKAISDPNLTPLTKLLRRRDLPPEVRASVEAYIEADQDLRAHLKWTQENSSQVSATRACGDVPILAASNQDRWRDGNRARQYAELRQIIESVGCPLKQELIAKGYRDEEIRARITFSVKPTPDGETVEIRPTVAQLDYDPGDRSRWAAEFDAARRGGCDRNGIWHPVFTLCGRVHGYFEENEAREFERRGSTLLLERVTVTLMATPSDPRSPDTRTSPEAAPAAPPGPTYSASFLDFREGSDSPIRFERGAPPPEGKRSRAVNRDTGEYLESYRPHWQHPTLDYLLHSADGTNACTATVEQEGVDLSGDGTVGLYKVRVLSIRQVSPDGGWSKITDPASAIARKFPPFIAAFLVDQLPARHSVEITFDLSRDHDLPSLDHE